MTDLQNQIIDAIKRKYEKALIGKGNLDPSLIKLVYEQTLESSKLRQLVVAMCVWDMEYEHFSKHLSQFPPDFKDDYALKQAERGRGNFAAKMPLIVSVFLPQSQSLLTRPVRTRIVLHQNQRYSIAYEAASDIQPTEGLPKPERRVFPCTDR